MASYNECWMEGFLQADPIVMNADDEGTQKILMRLKTIRRNVLSETKDVFEDVLVFYDGSGSREIMPRMEKLKKMDLVFIKGVIRILTLQRVSQCPHCGQKNIKYGATQVFIHPIYIEKKDSFSNLSKVENSRSAEEVLKNNYQEISHQILLMGNVVTHPEFITLKTGIPCCRYKLGVDRRYYLKTEADIKADYPWVYSYGEQAERDYRYLIGADKDKEEQGTLVLEKVFMHNRTGKAKQVCAACGQEYTYPLTVTDFVPYSVEYLENRRTDESIAAEEELRRRGGL